MSRSNLANRTRARLNLESLDGREQPSSWFLPDSGGGFVVHFGDGAPPQNVAPQIVDFAPEDLGGGLFRFTGRVIDESPAGLTVSFGGIPSMSGQSITTASDGTFTITVQLQTDGSDVGNVTASTLDPQGLASNVPLVYVNP